MAIDRQKWNRRDAFRLRGAVDRFSRRSPGFDRVGGGAGSTDLIVGRRRAMGSYFEIKLGANVPGAAGLIERTLDRVDVLESRLTVYRDDSELSMINARAHLGPTPIEHDVFELLVRAFKISEETGGAYDVTTGALSVAWGFFRGPRRVPDDATLADAKAKTGYRHVTLDSERRTIAFDRRGVSLNLGSIGKGYAIDDAIGEVRRHWWPTGAIVHGGRSSLFALGSPPGRLGSGWDVSVRNPFDPERPLGVLRLRNRGLGSSGDEFQRFEVDGRVFGHIIDPRTGEPASGPASVTVIAPTATEADALSTAFYLLGVDATEAYIDKYPGVAAVFVAAGTPKSLPKVVAIGLRGDEYEDDPTAPWLVRGSRQLKKINKQSHQSRVEACDLEGTGSGRSK